MDRLNKWDCICVLLAGHGYFVQTGRRLAGGRQQTCDPMHTHTHTHTHTTQHNAPYIDAHTRYCAYEGGTQYSPLCLALHLNVCFKIDLPTRQTRLYTAKKTFHLELMVRTQLYSMGESPSWKTKWFSVSQ